MRAAIHAHTVHSFPARPPFLPGSSAHVAPRARLRPRAPRVHPVWVLRGEPLNQPRLRGAGAGGEPGWGRGAGAPCGKPGGVGEPRPRRLQARSASVGRARAGGLGGGGSERRLPRGHVDGRPATGPAPPGGEYLRAGRARRGGGAGPPTPRGGLCTATEAAAPPSRRGGDCPASAPLLATPPPVPVPQGPAADASLVGRSRRALPGAEHSRGGAGTRPRRAVLPPERRGRVPGSHWRGPYPDRARPCCGRECGTGGQGEA